MGAPGCLPCLPCLIATQKDVPATHRYYLAVVHAEVAFCDLHLVTFRKFAGRVERLSAPDAR